MSAKDSIWNVGRKFLVLVLLMGTMAMSAPAVAQAPGTVSVDPTSGSPGSKVLVTGSFPDYGNGDVVAIWWDTMYTGRRLGSAPLRSDGTFAISIRIPPEAAMGAHQVIADVNAGYEQASTTFDVTSPDRSAVYIYDDDLNTASDFQELLEGNGLNTTLVQVDNVDSISFVPYDVILVGDDTGTGYDWSGSTAALMKVQNSGKPVLGLGVGGASLFEEMELYIRYGHCWTSADDTQVYVSDEQHPIWNVPYEIYVPYDLLVTVYGQGSTAEAVFLANPQGGVWPLGRQHDDGTHYPLIEEDGRFLLWGFYEGPSSMSQTGQDLFINAIYYLLWAFEVDTLILTNYDRMEDLGYSPADVAALENDINNLRGLPATTTNMTALHRDLSDDAPTEVQTACDSWDGNEGDVDLTNACVEAIDGYIEDLKQASYPNLYYVIIVGTTEIIPMKAREQDHLYSSMERNWGAGLPGASSYVHELYSTPGTVNGWGHYLTDSIYGDLSYVNDGWGTDHELIPELAVGRLVETPAQISDLIDTYIASNAYFAHSNRVSMAAYDYVDSGTLAADYMDPGTDDALVQSGYDSNDVPPKLNAKNDLVYFGGHGNYNTISTGGESFKAGDHAFNGDTADLSDMPNAVIVTAGCHNGASFGNQLYHAPDTGTTYSEFPEEFATKKVGVYVGATGYTAVTLSEDNTDVNEVRHNEKLSTYIIKHLYQDGTITAGEAFRRAVNSYVTDVGSIGTVERRVIAISTLYGIPNYRAPLSFVPRPWPIEYWMEPIWFGPPPYLDPGIFRYRIELQLRDWTIYESGLNGEWYLQILGAIYGGSAQEPLLPVFKTGVVLPPGSTCTGVEWDQAASESISWNASAPMYVPTSWETPADEQILESLEPPRFEHVGLFPVQTHMPYSTTTAGGAGTLAGLSIIPLQHDPQTLDTTLWTKLAFDVTCQASASTDADGDGLPTYWEASYRLNPNDAAGDQGASGDPDGDNLSNENEFGQGTDPQDPDTDDDGWGDGAEVAQGTNPLNPGSYPRQSYLPLILKNSP